MTGSTERPNHNQASGKNRVMIKTVFSSSSETGVCAHASKGPASSQTKTGEARYRVWCSSCTSVQHSSRQNIICVINDVTEGACHITSEIKYVEILPAVCFFLLKVWFVCLAVYILLFTFLNVEQLDLHWYKCCYTEWVTRLKYTIIYSICFFQNKRHL